jgi:hypothetical protein
VLVSSSLSICSLFLYFSLSPSSFYL